MKKALMIIVCIAVVSLFALGFLQAHTRTLNIQPKEDTSKISEQDAETSQQSQNTNVQQASQPNAIEDKGTLGDSCETQEQQTLNENGSSELTNDTSASQTAELAVPFPDGRIFLTTQTEPGDAIPYIPTENPKATSGIPLAPLEPDA
jgi:hypothetical protein